MAKTSLPLLLWDQKNKKLVIGPSAVIVVLAIIYACLALGGITVPGWWSDLIGVMTKSLGAL